MDQILKCKILHHRDTQQTQECFSYDFKVENLFKTRSRNPQNDMINKFDHIFQHTHNQTQKTNYKY